MNPSSQTKNVLDTKNVLVWLEREDGGGLWKEMWSELRARSDRAIGASVNKEFRL